MENNNNSIQICGAREHNLKNISLTIPKNTFTVITGLSGSGKSSLAFDTLYKEGQRRYLETFSAYARQFIGNFERPDVDNINGISPVIAIEQKTVNKNPRSTVGTITEIYDYLRVLYARIATPYSYNTGKKMVKYTESQLIELLNSTYLNKKIILLSPVVSGRKGHYRELFESFIKKGFTKAYIDNEIVDLKPRMMLDRYKTHDVDIVIDRLKLTNNTDLRLHESLKTALKIGKGIITIIDYETNKKQSYSKNLMCQDTGLAYSDPAPNLFSFNSPYGYCPNCNGLGHLAVIDEETIIPDNSLSINQGGLAPIDKNKHKWLIHEIELLSRHFKFDLSAPIKKIPENALNAILHGFNNTVKIKDDSLGITFTHNFNFDGIYNFIKNQFTATQNYSLKTWAKQYMTYKVCSTCNGQRLRKEALYYKINKKNISDLANLSLSDLQIWIKKMPEYLSDKEKKIAQELTNELIKRLSILNDLGLNYLNLNRPASSLSGGESQRIRLATQIGSQLVNVLYILDEPSIGLHQRDNHKLIHSLKQLRDIGNTVIVVEHDKDIMLSADYIIDLGPGAGRKGGEVIAQGDISTIKNANSITGKYISNKITIPLPENRHKGNGKNITIEGATGHNLKNITVQLPLGKLICVSGVSGSGKTSLINETLFPAISKILYRSKQDALPHKAIHNIKNIDKIIKIDQNPIGKTPRSNPATYTGVFTEIRDVFSKTVSAKIRGYKPGRFSFNVKGGRCETCQGSGVQTIEMHFLPDVYVACNTCKGKRYNRETLEIIYKDKSISDVLDMTINEAYDFFQFIPSAHQKLKMLKEVGLGYIKLGQSSTTLSGGESQRVKLASELSKKQTGNTLYILDEPTTGLHFEDIRVLMQVIDKLVDFGNTVIIIEHNLDVLKLADHIIDLGPEGGDKGGEIVAQGTPEQVAANLKSITGKYLKSELKLKT